MTKDIQREQIGVWSSKDELQKSLAAGLHGAPELKRDEKLRYLGEFRERVIRQLTKKQVMEPGIYPEIVEALKDPRTDRLIICGTIEYDVADKYRDLADDLGKKCTVVRDPDMIGDTGLIVVSATAADVEDIDVPDRKQKLSQKGVAEGIINAAGEKLCDKCYAKIIAAEPGEVINYQKLSFSDRFWGGRCAACSKK